MFVATVVLYFYHRPLFPERLNALLGMRTLVDQWLRGDCNRSHGCCDVTFSKSSLIAVHTILVPIWPFSFLLADGALARETKGSGDMGFLNSNVFDWLFWNKEILGGNKKRHDSHTVYRNLTTAYMRIGSPGI